MMSVILTATAFMATSIQAWSSAVELGRANRPVIEWWDAEDQLVAEERRLRRRRARRLLVAERDARMRQEIRRVKWTLGSWIALMAVSGTACVDTLV